MEVPMRNNVCAWLWQPAEPVALGTSMSAAEPSWASPSLWPNSAHKNNRAARCQNPRFLTRGFWVTCNFRLWLVWIMYRLLYLIWLWWERYRLGVLPAEWIYSLFSFIQPSGTLHQSPFHCAVPLNEFPPAHLHNPQDSCSDLMLWRTQHFPLYFLNSSNFNIILE